MIKLYDVFTCDKDGANEEFAMRAPLNVILRAFVNYREAEVRIVNDLGNQGHASLFRNHRAVWQFVGSPYSINIRATDHVLLR